VIPERAHLVALFEGAPRFLDRLAALAPFDDDAAMFAAARRIAHAMPEDEQVELIDAHPRLGAPASTMSALSFVEQGYDQDAAEANRQRLAATLDRRNDAYEARFGFRYCIFVAGRPREALLPYLDAALLGDRRDELHRALDAVVDIAMDRHAKLSPEAPS